MHQNYQSQWKYNKVELSHYIFIPVMMLLVYGNKQDMTMIVVQ